VCDLTVRVDTRVAIAVSAFWASAAVRSVSRTPPSSSLSAWCSAVEAAARPPPAYAGRAACPEPQSWSASNLLPDSRSVSTAEPQAHSPDVPVLGFVPVDRVLATPTPLARGLRHGASHNSVGSRFAFWLPATRAKAPKTL
jgi:hypothetical protein